MAGDVLDPVGADPGGSSRKVRIRALVDAQAGERAAWVARNAYYHDADVTYLRFLVPPGRRILDLGCGTGRVLAALDPSHGVGVDFSPEAVAVARREYPGLEFVVGDVEDPAVLAGLQGPFDVILLSDTVGSLEDVQATLLALHPLCGPATRVVLTYFNSLWSPLLRIAQAVGDRMPDTDQNWLSAHDLAGLLTLADFDVVKIDRRQVLPKRAGGLGPVVNRFVGTLPGVHRAALRNYVVARSRRQGRAAAPSVSIVVPCRNEAGNVAAAVERTPPFAPDIEFVFVEGGSRDGTYEAVEAVVAAHPDRRITLRRQDGTGKGNAVRNGLEAATGEVLIILDADLTVPPEDLPKFYEAVVEGRGELVMGSRLVYPEEDAMRILNTAGNKVFSLLFTWLLNQRITDTLCGTKALRRDDYERIRAGRSYFGEFDPFGDFDLIFGAAKQNLKIVEIPVRYRSRTYGSTQISRFRHGLLLLRMTGIAYRRLKAV